MGTDQRRSQGRIERFSQRLNEADLVTEAN